MDERQDPKEKNTAVGQTILHAYAYSSQEVTQPVITGAVRVSWTERCRSFLQGAVSSNRPLLAPERLIVAGSLLACFGITLTSYTLVRAVHHSRPTRAVSVSVQTVPSTMQPPTSLKPTTSDPIKTGTAQPTPAPVVNPKPAASPQPTLPPTLPVKVGKNTSYSVGVLVIKYFPLTANGQNINIAVTGDAGDTYASIRQHTIDATNILLSNLSGATRYLGYKYSDPPALAYHVVDIHEYTAAVPIKGVSGRPTYPDYQGIMLSQNICDYVNNRGVSEVWLWAYQGPNKPGTNYPYLSIDESKMSGPYGDISNSYRYNDLPLCKHTYRVYTFNYGRTAALAAHSWGHQIEAELKAVDSNLFSLFQGPNYPQLLSVTGRCGSVHNPPNARFEYDWYNPVPQASDCEDWTPDGMGTTILLSCRTWSCDQTNDNGQLAWMVFMWQNLPGMNNTKSYQGRPLRNWWDVHGDFDNVMGGSKRLTL